MSRLPNPLPLNLSDAPFTGWDWIKELDHRPGEDLDWILRIPRVGVANLMRDYRTACNRAHNALIEARAARQQLIAALAEQSSRADRGSAFSKARIALTRLSAAEQEGGAS